MPEDYYDDGPAGPRGGQDEGGKEEEQEHKGEETYLLPKSVLVGKPFQPGDELVLEVVRLLDDQVEVKYSWGDKGEEEHEEKGGEEAAPAKPAGGGEGGEMASMMY